MLNDAVPSNFAGIYLVCGYTDLRYGIDSLASIIERRYKVNLFVPTCAPVKLYQGPGINY